MSLPTTGGGPALIVLAVEPGPAAPGRPAPWAEFAGRLLVCACLATLLYALWSPRLEGASAWLAKELRVLPRMTVFVLAVLVALVVQGARATRGVLLTGGALAALAAFCLLPWAELWTIPARGNDSAASDASPARNVMLLAGPVLQLLRFQASLFAAVLLGTWLGRRIETSGELVVLLFCAIAGDVWLSTFRVPESVDPTHPLRLLRLPWPPSVGQLGLSPAFTDLLFLSATLEAGRALRLHTLSVVFGAMSGYCAGSFLGLDPWPAWQTWPAWPALSMAMFTSGVIIGCWPELKCKARDMARALLLGALLLAALLAMASVQRMLSPTPEPPSPPGRYRYVT